MERREGKGDEVASGRARSRRDVTTTTRGRGSARGRGRARVAWIRKKEAVVARAWTAAEGRKGDVESGRARRRGR